MTISFESSADELDRFDTMPTVSTIFSAPLRAGIALVQIVAGAFFGVAAAGEYLFTRNDRYWNISKDHFREIGHGVQNLGRAIIALVPFIGNMILSYRPPRVVLTRDAEGYYTITPHAKIPGMAFGERATLRSKEFLFRQGDTIFLDTQAKILPPGWVLKN